MITRGTRSVPVRAMAAAALLTTTGVLPVFLIGALAPFLARDLAFEQLQLGTTVACYYAASALGSLAVGRLVERAGPRRAGAVAASVEVVVLLAVGFGPLTWHTLTALMFVAGLANGTGQLAANLSIAVQVPPERRGLGFGVKQSAVPAASLIGGLCVPTLALTVGWRWAFSLSVLIFPLWLALSSRPGAGLARTQHSQPRGRVLQPSLVIAAFAAVAGAAAANAMAAFFVSSAVAMAVPAAAAGVLLAVAGCAGITSRIVLGWYADRRPANTLRVVAVLMAVGAAGLLLVSSGILAAIAFGIALGYAAGWGWNGLLTFAVAKAHPEAPAVATGVTQAGVYAGGILGPPLFGMLVEAASYQAAWIGASALLALGAGLALASSLRSLAARPEGSAQQLSVKVTS